MAMLAEPRQKSNYVLMPRGKPLYEDSSRFGTKMLEKMGWSKGNGLGPKENGKKDFVRLTYKNGFTGLGYEDKNDQWTSHDEVFSGLLKSLNSSNNAPKPEEESVSPILADSVIPQESLEEKSKKSKARVHYKRYTKGKDLSQYSEKDLANIFGKKSIAEFTPFKIINTISNDNDETFKFGVPTVDTGKSMHDYFKSKMQFKKVISNPAVSERELSPVDATVNDISLSNSKKTKKSKKSEKDKNYEVDVASELLQATQENNIDNDFIDEPPSYKKSKKHKKERSENHSLNMEIIETNIVSKKKSKKNKNAFEPNDNSVCNLDKYVSEEQPIESGTKPKNKKRKHQERGDNIEANSEEVCRKKKRKSEIILNNTLEENYTCELSINPKHQKRLSEENIAIQESEPMLKQPEKALKKKEHVHDDKIITESQELSINPKYQKILSEENIALQESVPLLEETEKTLKKKKKKEHIHDDKIITESQDVINLDDFVDEDNTQIQKIKNHKKTRNELPSEMVKEKPLNTEQHVPKTAETKFVQSIKNLDFKSPKNFIINSYVAEKFRYTNLDGFEGSNIKSVVGYGIASNFKLIVVEKPSDEIKIANMWDEAVNKCNKYEDEEDNKAGSNEEIPDEPKIKFGLLKRKLKRKSYFKGI